MQSREKRILVFVRRTVGLFGNRCVTSPHALTGGFGACCGDESVKGTATAIRLPPEEPDNGRNRSLDHLMARGEGRGRAREQVEAPLRADRGREIRCTNELLNFRRHFLFRQQHSSTLRNRPFLIVFLVRVEINELSTQSVV